MIIIMIPVLSDWGFRFLSSQLTQRKPGYVALAPWSTPLPYLSVFQEGVQCWRPLRYSVSQKEKENTCYSHLSHTVLYSSPEVQITTIVMNEHSLTGFDQSYCIIGQCQSITAKYAASRLKFKSATMCSCHVKNNWQAMRKRWVVKYILFSFLNVIFVSCWVLWNAVISVCLFCTKICVFVSLCEMWFQLCFLSQFVNVLSKMLFFH